MGEGLAEWIIMAPGGEQMAYFDRRNQPVVMEFGPVLDLEDALGGKVAALASRSYERDYWDTSAALERYTPEQLIAFARRLDPGLQPEDFADAGRRLDRTADEAFADLGLTDQDIATLRARFTQWPREAEARPDRETGSAHETVSVRDQPEQPPSRTGSKQTPAPPGAEPSSAAAPPELGHDAAIDDPEPEPELG
jgi:hypothetical protein